MNAEQFYAKALRDFTADSPVAQSPVRDLCSEWGAPEPIVAESEGGPYPVGKLPAAIREAVAQVQGFTQAPVALVGSSALSALSLAAQPHATVRRADGLEGPPCLFLLTLAESGERKSTVDERFVAPIREYERDAAERAKPDIAQHRADLRTWEAKVKGVEARIARNARDGKDTEADRAELQRLEERKPQEPLIPRLLYTDATPEALSIGLYRWPSAGLMSAEAGAILGGHGMGRETVMRFLALLNSAWDGRMAPTDRVSRGPQSWRDIRLTCGLAAQPEAVRSFVEDSKGLARGTGFLARFLVAKPASTQGTRSFREAPKGWPALATYQERLRGLLELPVRFEGGELRPPTLELSRPARDRWIAFHDDVERELGAAGMLAEARDFAAKAADNAARMAALFHLYDHGPEGDIGLDSIEAAASVVTWHALEALRFSREIVTPQSVTSAQRLEAWLLANCDGGEVKKSRVFQYGPGGDLRKKAALDEALEVLEAANRARPVVIDGTLRIRVNPALLEVP